jgi:hypothetical protein
MTEKKQAKPKKKVMRFTVGGNLTDGSRFEAGEEVPANLTAKEKKALKDCMKEGE